MAITGQGSTLALGVEPSWGTAASATIGVPFLSETFSDEIARIEPETLAGDNLMMTNTGWRAGGTTVTGTIDGHLYDLGFEELFRGFLGGYTYNVDTHEFTPGTFAESYTWELGLGGDTTVDRKRLTGGAVTGWAIAAEIDQMVTCRSDWVGKAIDVSASETISATYATGQEPFSYEDVGTITVEGQTFECVKGLTLSATHPLETARRCLGTTEIADPRIEVGDRVYTGTLTLDFEGYAIGAHDLYAAYVAGSELDLAVTMTSPNTHTFTIAGQFRVDGGQALVGGKGIITPTVPIKFQADPGDDSTGLKITMTNGTSTLT